MVAEDVDVPDKACLIRDTGEVPDESNEDRWLVNPNPDRPVQQGGNDFVEALAGESKVSERGKVFQGAFPGLMNRFSSDVEVPFRSNLYEMGVDAQLDLDGKGNQRRVIGHFNFVGGRWRGD
jgi:hypothetical protein